MRPDRVRLRQRILALTARTAITHPARETEDVATLLFETDARVLGSTVIWQVSAGRKNHLWFELGGTEAAVGFDQEQPETLWVGGRAGVELVPRDAATLSPEAAAGQITTPGGHPQGYQDRFDAFVAETYAAIGGHRPADGLPGFADGLRAAATTPCSVSAAPAAG